MSEAGAAYHELPTARSMIRTRYVRLLLVCGRAATRRTLICMGCSVPVAVTCR